MAAWEEAVDAAPERPSLERPRIAAIAPGTHKDTATELRVDMDPAAPAAAFFAYSADGGASLVPSKRGPVLYASKPGAVTVHVAAATSRLVTAVLDARVEAR